MDTLPDILPSAWHTFSLNLTKLTLLPPHYRCGNRGLEAEQLCSVHRAGKERDWGFPWSQSHALPTAASPCSGGLMFSYVILVRGQHLSLTAKRVTWVQSHWLHESHSTYKAHLTVEEWPWDGNRKRLKKRGFRRQGSASTAPSSAAESPSSTIYWPGLHSLQRLEQEQINPLFAWLPLGLWKSTQDPQHLWWRNSTSFAGCSVKPLAFPVGCK